MVTCHRGKYFKCLALLGCTSCLSSSTHLIPLSLPSPSSPLLQSQLKLGCVSGCTKGLVIHWDVNTGTCINELGTYGSAVLQLESTSTHVVGLFSEACVRVWNSARGEMACKIQLVGHGGGTETRLLLNIMVATARLEIWLCAFPVSLLWFASCAEPLCLGLCPPCRLIVLLSSFDFQERCGCAWSAGRSEFQPGPSVVPVCCRQFGGQSEAASCSGINICVSCYLCLLLVSFLQSCIEVYDIESGSRHSPEVELEVGTSCSSVGRRLEVLDEGSTVACTCGKDIYLIPCHLKLKND